MASKYIRILSIDGGGIRGILPGQILVSVEKMLQRKTKDPNAKIADYFDLIAGTSTGGILSCLYLYPDEKNPKKPKYSATEAVDLYLKHGSKIFDVPFLHKLTSQGGLSDEKYPAKALESLLLQFFGEKKLSELVKPCLVTAYDIERRKAHFFTQHEALKKDSYDFLIRDVARSTSAAPTFFEPANVHSLSGVGYPLIDGGLFANNPALCAYAEIKSAMYETDRRKITPENILMLSLGTGNIEKKYEYNKAKDWGMIGWIKPVLDILMSGVSETVDYQLKQLFSSSEVPDHYVRIDPVLHDASPEMDDAQKKNLTALKEAGIENAENNDAILEAFVSKLIL